MLNSNSFLSSHLFIHFTYSWATTLDKRNQGHKNVSKNKHGPCHRGIYIAVWLLSHLESLQCSFNAFFLPFYLLKNNLHTNFPNVSSCFPPQPSKKKSQDCFNVLTISLFPQEFHALLLFYPPPNPQKTHVSPSSISVTDTTVHSTV